MVALEINGAWCLCGGGICDTELLRQKSIAVRYIKS